MIYPNDFEVRIGFDKIRATLARSVYSTVASEMVEAIKMSADRDEIEAEIVLVHEMLTILRMESDWVGGGWCDTRFLRKLRVVGVSLDTAELVVLRKAIDKGSGVKAFFESHEQYKFLGALGVGLEDFREVRQRIDRIIDINGRIKDNASEALQEIRRELNRKSSQVGVKLEQILRAAQAEGFADSDSSVSVRDNRAVIPVAAGFKRKIKGIVHSESASGRTAFIEPLEVVELNNAIRELEIAETQEILKILAQFSDFVREYIDGLLDMGDYVARFEFLEAKAKMASNQGATKPIFSDSKAFDLRQARHPLLEQTLKAEKRAIVPLNVSLDEKSRILLISGPNAGGKSVCLKTVGLLQYMLQCGLLVPLLDNSEMTIFESIFIDIGDQQSIESDLSTYSSHLYNMKQFLRSANHNSLILIDEFGGGTEPTFGGAIAEAMLGQFLQKETFGIITTHYANLKFFAAANDGIINGAMTFDVNKIQPLFELEQGRAGNSFAIEIARKIGLSSDIIEKAQDLVGVNQVNIEKQLRDAARDKRYWETKREKIKKVEKGVERSEIEMTEQLEELKAKRNEIIRQAKEQAKELIAQANRQVEATIREIRESQANKEKTKEARGALKGFAEQIDEKVSQDELIARKMEKIKQRQQKRALRQPEDGTKAVAVRQIKRDLAVGDSVIMKGGNVVGKIETIDGKNAVVLFGNLRTKIDTKRLELAGRQQKRSDETFVAPPNTNFSTLDRKLNFKESIDIRGERAADALEKVKLFIDEAIMFSSEEVRILHGKGDGILKEMIRQYLRTEPAVSELRDEHVERGGAGITIVRF